LEQGFGASAGLRSQPIRRNVDDGIEGSLLPANNEETSHEIDCNRRRNGIRLHAQHTRPFGRDRPNAEREQRQRSRKPLLPGEQL